MTTAATIILAYSTERYYRTPSDANTPYKVDPQEAIIILTNCKYFTQSTTALVAKNLQTSPELSLTKQPVVLVQFHEIQANS